MRPQPQPPFHHMNNNNNMRGPMPPGPGFKDGSNQPLINPTPFSMDHQQQQQPTAPYPMQPKMPQPMNFGISLLLLLY